MVVVRTICVTGVVVGYARRHVCLRQPPARVMPANTFGCGNHTHGLCPPTRLVVVTTPAGYARHRLFLRRQVGR